MKILHISTVHPRKDTRIFVKELKSIRKSFEGSIYYLVQDGLPDQEIDGIHIRTVGPKLPRQRHRLALGIWRMLRRVLQIKPQIVHFHDPELIPVGLLLKMFGIRVIYDVHEDVPKQLLSGGPMPRIPAHVVGWLYLVLEGISKRVFDACIIAAPVLNERFSKEETVLLQNFASLSEFPKVLASVHADLPCNFVYVGGITAARGIFEMVDAIGRLPNSAARLQIAGTFSVKDLERRVVAVNGWPRVDWHGQVGRDGVQRLLRRARAGLVLFHPMPNHVRAQPNKMFEYMAAGLPVIASDFPLWREIVEGAGCGLLVDPQDPQAIAVAMQWILDNPQEAAAMGRRGRTAVEERFNWEAESEKLVALYRRLLTKRR